MPTPWRTLLADAVQRRLSDTHPAIPVHRARRVEVAEHERPCITVMLGDSDMDESVSVGEIMVVLTLMVGAYPAAQPSDSATEDALAAMEASIVAALQGEALATPDGQDLTLGIYADSAQVTIYPAEQSGPRLGDVLLSLRAQALLPRGNLTL